MEVQGAVEIRDVEPGEWGTGVPTLHLEDRCLDKDLEGSHRGLFTDNSLALNSKRNNQNRGVHKFSKNLGEFASKSQA